MTSIEYNTDLAMYPHSEFEKGRRSLEECLPTTLEVDASYPFVKLGHRNYAIGSLVTLLEIQKYDVIFTMRARVEIVESFFLIEEKQSYTRGIFVVRELLSD